ncbi:MAG: CDP-alcohol phosphatidyltransferase family protein [Bacteroidia bacterium]
MFSEKNLPNVFTCLNLLCGCLALVSLFDLNAPLLISVVLLAGLFDFFDGLTARALNAYSDFGKQLDSLADVVTFGVVPGMVLHRLITNYPQSHEIVSIGFLFTILKYFPFIITVFAAFRLAKFNIDSRQTKSFLGLPVPAMGIFVTSFIPIIKYDQWDLAPILTNPFFIIAITIVLSALMISEIPLFALKFSNWRWKENKIQYIFIIISVMLLIRFIFAAIPLIVFLYIILSIINNSMLKRAGA